MLRKGGWEGGKQVDAKQMLLAEVYLRTKGKTRDQRSLRPAEARKMVTCLGLSCSHSQEKKPSAVIGEGAEEFASPCLNRRRKSCQICWEENFVVLRVRKGRLFFSFIVDREAKLSLWLAEKTSKAVRVALLEAGLTSPIANGF